MLDFQKQDHYHDTYLFSLCQVWIDQRQVREEMAAVKLGCWITVDKSHCAGWYNSPCTIQPNLKPISIGATLHSLDVTHGKLKFYKLYTCILYVRWQA